MKLAPYYDDFVNKAGIAVPHSPKSFQVNLTNRCYSKCIGCRKYKWPGAQLTTEQVYKIIDFLHENGGESIVFSGGEPFCHPDFKNIVNYAYDKKLYIGILTSLILPHKLIKHGSYLNILAKADWVAVSIDAMTSPKAYKRMRGVDALYYVVNRLDEIKLYNEESKTSYINVRVNSTISNINIDEMAAILVACANLNIKRCDFFPIHTWNDLKITDIVKATKCVANAQQALDRNKVRSNIDSFISLMGRKWQSKCVAGFFHCFIDADGMMFPCCRLANDNGDFKERNLSYSFGHVNFLEDNHYGTQNNKIRAQLLKNANTPVCKECDRYNKINADYLEFTNIRDGRVKLFL